MADHPLQHTCWICGKELSLQTCKADEKGRMVHEHCYTLRMQLERDSARQYANRGFMTGT